MTTQASPVVATPAAPAKPLTAIQLIEQQLANFLHQKEVAIANVHAIDGAIQGAKATLALLKTEVAKAEALAKEEAVKVETDVKEVFAEVKAEATKAVATVETELKKL